MSTQSTKRESFIIIEGKGTRIADDVHSWLTRYAEARGYKPLVRAIENLVRTVRDYVPIQEEVTLKKVDNRGDKSL